MNALQGMVPAGYMAKSVAIAPAWGAAAVSDIYSVSDCMSKAFCEFAGQWKHNGFWLFDSPALITQVAREAGVGLAGRQMFYYEVFGRQFDEALNAWRPVEPQNSFATNVLAPSDSCLEGFDVVSFSAGTGPECSPLSCNGLAGTIAVNTHCLLNSFDEARRLLEAGAFSGSEPGPFRIFAVYSCKP